MWKRIHHKQIVIDPKVRALCIKAYPGHIHGCPNFGKREACPPQAPLWVDEVDACFPVWFIWNEFDLGAHVEKMRSTHPDWSQRMLYNPLYWQGTARKQLRTAAAQVLQYTKTHNYPQYTIYYCPEAMGIDVTHTALNIGVILQWPAVTVARQIAFAAISNQGVI